MAFRTENRKISNIFEGQKIYTVPRYQRNYIWDKNNWSELLDDIEFTLGNENNMEWSHFLGAIVLSKKKHKFPSLGIEEYEIIDGQQRLTTIFILFLNIFAKLKKIEKENFIENTYIIVRKMDGSVGFKFENFELNNDILNLYQSIVDNEKVQGNSKIIELFLFFQEKLEKYDSTSIERFLNNLLSINLVEIISEEDEEIYNIFEVLNARGQKLKQMELLKNRVMKYITPKETDVIDKAKDKWRKIEENLTENSDIDTPLYHFTKCYIRKKALNKDSVYKLIKSEIKINDINKFLDDLLEFSSSYKEISKKDETNIYIRYFNIKRNQQIRTLITALHIKLYKFFDLPDKYEAVLKELRNLFFIFNLTKQTSNTTDKLITDFSYKIYHSSTINELKIIITELLLKLKGMISYKNIEENLITNSALKYSNKKDSGYQRNSTLVKYILGEIYKNSHQDILINIDNMTIEHLKSDNGLDDTSRLSNLTLVTRELNEKLRNRPILEKIEILKNESDILENKNLEKFIENDAFSFEKRLKWFSEKISNDIFNVNPQIFNINNNDIITFQKLSEKLKEHNELLKLLKELGTEFENKLEKDPKLETFKIEFEKIIKK
ncbi:DUF262 domain-containing protein [Cetobacterium sp.]|uniref:DUF262 domain-containing protein n=1 Tax=Cetobacterium sp. TaxID=2071632 RepID=UPI003EE700E5